VPYPLFLLISVRYDFIVLFSELTRTTQRSQLPFPSALVSSSVCLLLLYLLHLISPLIITERDTAVLPTLVVSIIYRYIKPVSCSSHRYVLFQTDEPSKFFWSQTNFLRTQSENLWPVCSVTMQCATFAAPHTNQQFTEKCTVGRLSRIVLGPHLNVSIF
jgi:hypothetical protein